MEEQNAEQAIVEVETPKDWPSFRRYYWFTSIRSPLMAIYYSLFFILSPAFILYLVIGFAIYGELDLLWDWMRIIVPLILMAVYLLVRPRYLYMRRKKHFGEPDTHIFYEEHTTVSSSGGNMLGYNQDVTYDYFRQAYETKHMFYLKTQNGGWYFIDREFLDPGQAQALRDLFARKFGERFKTKQAK